MRAATRKSNQTDELICELFFPRRLHSEIVYFIYCSVWHGWAENAAFSCLFVIIFFVWYTRQLLCALWSTKLCIYHSTILPRNQVIRIFGISGGDDDGLYNGTEELLKGSTCFFHRWIFYFCKQQQTNGKREMRPLVCIYNLIWFGSVHIQRYSDFWPNKKTL